MSNENQREYQAAQELGTMAGEQLRSHFSDGFTHRVAEELQRTRNRQAQESIGTYQQPHYAAAVKTGTIGTAQMPRAPGKMFTRSDILAIIRAQHALALNETASGEWKAAKNSALRDLISIFENLD